MSHQTGIRACESLKNKFAESKGGTIRLLNVTIENESMILKSFSAPNQSLEEDYDEFVTPCLQAQNPAFLLVRLDTQNATGYEWLFISYSPDNAAVRQKMLYAATRSTLKQEFGTSHILTELFGTLPDDVTYEGYLKHLTAENAPAPLTFAEEELLLIKKNEVRVDISVDSKHQTMQGLCFPLDDVAQVKLAEIREHKISYVRLVLDLDNERVLLEDSKDIDTASLRSEISLDNARYHFFLYKHTHEAEYMENIVFIYSMPGFKSSIKERMLYSSCKAPLLEYCEQVLKITIDKKMEIDSRDDVSADNLYRELHPIKNVVKQKFAKPKPPQSRAARRARPTAAHTSVDTSADNTTNSTTDRSSLT